MPAAGSGAPTGLGTSIIEALARQLKGRVVVAAMAPGTKVSIIGESGGARPAAEQAALADAV